MREKNQETQVDIIAEMRMGSQCGPCAYRIGLPDKEEVYESGAKRRITMIKNVTVQELADRLEAAGKREKAQHGNAAAMREALKPWIAFGEWLLGNAGKDRLGEAIRENGPIIRQRIEELRGALSAPARNCDRFDTVREAAIAFAAEYQKQPHPCPDFIFSRWLLATAAERKGE